MKPLLARLPVLSYVLLAAYLMSMAARSHSESTLALVLSALAMFACCWVSATHLLGPRAALRFIAIAVLFGWFAEQMGASRGWFFGDYRYTDVLGPRIGDVPAIIPLMWFALTYTGYVLAFASALAAGRPNDPGTGGPDDHWVEPLGRVDPATHPHVARQAESLMRLTTDDVITTGIDVVLDAAEAAARP